jgi:hypothetical protein
MREKQQPSVLDISRAAQYFRKALPTVNKTKGFASPPSLHFVCLFLEREGSSFEQKGFTCKLTVASFFDVDSLAYPLISLKERK